MVGGHARRGYQRIGGEGHVRSRHIREDGVASVLDGGDEGRKGGGAADALLLEFSHQNGLGHAPRGLGVMGGRLKGGPGEDMAFCQGGRCGPSLFVDCCCCCFVFLQGRHVYSLPPPSLKGGALLRHGPGEYLLLGNRFVDFVRRMENHGTGLTPRSRHDALKRAISDKRVESLSTLCVDVFQLHVGRANRLVRLRPVL